MQFSRTVTLSILSQHLEKVLFKSREIISCGYQFNTRLDVSLLENDRKGFGPQKSDLGSRPQSTKNLTRRTVGCRAVTRRTVGRGWLEVPSSGLCGEPLALDCLGWDSEGLYMLVGDCNSLSNARLLTPHSSLVVVSGDQ
ncbi:hypothetical protein F2Q68_00033616 [Brassica cretica]|uniref:Uncharacterized protein n=1 Tax=Brassica cretica TaxID=69181 RepID=A0A8S9H4U7_BRACR|nr:hypothetical protein F2Q68_00033616 [Brassica cretica]